MKNLLQRPFQSKFAFSKKRQSVVVHVILCRKRYTVVFFQVNITKVRSLFSLSHRGSDTCNSPLLIVFRPSIVTFLRLKVFRKLRHVDLGRLHARSDTKTTFIIFKNTSLRLKYDFWLVEIMARYAKLIQSLYNVQLNTISTWELSHPLSNSVKRGLILVRFVQVISEPLCLLFLLHCYSSYGGILSASFKEDNLCQNTNELCLHVT